LLSQAAAEAMANQRPRRLTAECEVNSGCVLNITAHVVVRRIIQPDPAVEVRPELS